MIHIFHKWGKWTNFRVGTDGIGRQVKSCDVCNKQKAREL